MSGPCRAVTVVMGLFTKGTMRSSTNSLSTHNKATLLSTFVQRKPTVVLQKPSTSHCQRFSWSILGAIGAGVQGLLDILGKSQPGPQVRSCAPEWWALALQAPAHPAGCHLNVLVAVGQDTQDNHHLTSLSIRWSFFLCLHMAQFGFIAHQNTQPYQSWWRWGHIGSIILILPTVMAHLAQFNLHGPVLCGENWGWEAAHLQWAEGVTNSKWERSQSLTAPGAGRVMPSSLSRRPSWPLLSISLSRGCIPTSLASAATSALCTVPAALVRQGQGKCWWCCGMGTKNCCQKPHSTLQPRRHSVLQVSQVCSAGIQTWVHAGLWRCLNLYSES